MGGSALPLCSSPFILRKFFMLAVRSHEMGTLPQKESGEITFVVAKA
jgi:hypothetical protein